MRPSKNDYAVYYHKYIQELESDNILETLEKQLNENLELFNSIPEEKANTSYDVGKWSIKELLGHMVDTERIFAYRALCIARGEKQSLPGMEQDDYVKEAEFNKRSFKSLVDEYGLLRNSNLVLFYSFGEKELNKRGTANNSDVTVRAILFIIAGHELHHIKILKERYLN
ncbi:MAG TPA: DinB family protein [Ignavibacteriaceae bacterium]|nr:DinB family protein [Ignavibacteriaceae bacterium]